jgi:hypothetical protein
VYDNTKGNYIFGIQMYDEKELIYGEAVILRKI